MVGVMAGGGTKDKALHLLNSIKFSTDVPSKIGSLGQLKEFLVSGDPSLLEEFVPLLVELQSDRSSPVRKLVAEIVGEIGFKHMSFLAQLVPILIYLLKDSTPAVARRAVITGTDLFHKMMQYVALQDSCSEEQDSLLESSWAWLIKLKEAMYQIAFQAGNDGAQILAIKFVKSTVLFTPNPSISSRSAPQANIDEVTEFNISWLRSGHPLLTASDLALEASRNLGLLLDMLRSPSLKSLSNSIVVVLINSLSAIARKRPAFYGRILPVLLALDPSVCLVNRLVPGVPNALVNAFLACLNCAHPGALPWRDKLVEALKAMDAGDMAEEALFQLDKISSEGQPLKDGKHNNQTFESSQNDQGKRRYIAEESDFVTNDDSSGKRVRQTLLVSQGPCTQTNSNLEVPVAPLDEARNAKSDGGYGPVQQLVAMFGALVAQGDKAVHSLEILIGSISSDLLAEVVIANMHHLPPCRPNNEGDEEDNLSAGFISSLFVSAVNIQPSANALDNVSLLNALPQAASTFNGKLAVSCDSTVVHHVEKTETRETTDTTSEPASIADQDIPVVSTVPSHSIVPSVSGNFVVQSMINDVGPSEASIHGLEGSVPAVGCKENERACYASTAGSVGTYQEDARSSVPLFVKDETISIGTDHSETLSPRESGADTSWISSSTSKSVFLSAPLSLSRMMPPTVNLSEDQKDQLQKLAYVRIIDAYKNVAISGGSDIHFSLLAYVGSEYPLQLDVWALLQKHILADYSNHEGHELTLRVLYRLFAETEQEYDFFASTTATSVYETFLLTVAETLRDCFPASDKSLSRLFGEVPYLPKPAFQLLECLCSPGNNDKPNKELQSGDRVTQGLSAVWNLILVRPPIRDACLKIALQSAIHHLEEVRMKAIRLVANKLYPLTFIAQTIEDFASEKLLSVINNIETAEAVTDGSAKSMVKQLASPESSSPDLVSEARRCMSLYFALCTKKHSLLWKVFTVYKSATEAAKEAIRKHIPVLVRTIGASAELLSIISDLPGGSENLLTLVLHTLSDGAIPSQDLIYAVKRLYDSKLKDVSILIPILPFMPKDEVLPIFSKLVDLPLDKFRVALSCLLQGSYNKHHVLAPAEVLIAIHGIDPDKDGIALKKVMDACTSCFEMRAIFTQQVLAKVLNQLVEQIPLPLLFMRTVIQSIGAFPSLVDFIMDILTRLVNKQIWKFPKLWVGFLKCAMQTQPQSFGVLLQLPAAQLENALNRNPPLKPPLVAHASQPNIRSSLPRSTLVVLGLASDSQTTSQAQSAPQTSDLGNTSTIEATETTQEASAGG